LHLPPRDVDGKHATIDRVVLLHSKPEGNQRIEGEIEHPRRDAVVLECREQLEGAEPTTTSVPIKVPLSCFSEHIGLEIPKLSLSWTHSRRTPESANQRRVKWPSRIRRASPDEPS
jgi:hypothetical protein